MPPSAGRELRPRRRGGGTHVTGAEAAQHASELETACIDPRLLVNCGPGGLESAALGAEYPGFATTADVHNTLGAQGFSESLPGSSFDQVSNPWSSTPFSADINTAFSVPTTNIENYTQHFVHASQQPMDLISQA